MEKEYNVILKKGVDYTAFGKDMITITNKDGVPNREINVANERLGSYRQTHYYLTDEEAEMVKNHPDVLTVEIPPQDRDDIQITPFGRQSGTFTKNAGTTENHINYALLRSKSQTNNYGTSDTLADDYLYNLDGTGVDIVIQDTGIEVNHPEFTIAGAIDSEYNNGALSNVIGNGSDFFKREVTVNGVRIVAAGTVGGQTAVPDAFIEKVARMFELFTDPNGAGINEVSQRNFIKTLSGDAGTYHAAQGPTLQRVARGAGADYTPNFLTDAGIVSWNLSPLLDTHVANDMVWYLNSTGDAPGDGDNDAQEVIEHVFHTLHMHGLDAVSLKMYSYISVDWASGPLYAAMEEAYDAGKWDSSGYGGNAWKTDGNAFEVAAKEYLFLLNFGMFEYSSLWDGGSLSPEWTDDMRTQSGIQANNPLGYALHNTYIAPVISKPSLTTIRSIFQDGDVGDPTVAGASGYVVSTASTSRVQQIDWASVSGLPFTQSVNHYRDYHGHGTHVGSTVAGKNFGWAKNAKIYALKVSGLEGVGDEGTGISVTYCFDAIKLWHRNKPIDPKTGFKRPTVVNMSWGYGLSYTSVSSMNYRGVTYTDSTISTANNRWSNYGLVPYILNGNYYTNIRVASVDIDIEELVDEGVHVVIAAGNRSHKVDIVGGDDYNNSATTNNGTVNYHRGSSPQGGGSILVGSLDSGSYDATNDQASTYTEKGAGVDIYAHGTKIMAASSNVNEIGGYTYFYDNSFKQVAISGTSMAAPQVSGVITLMLQANPNATPSELKTSLLNKCGNVLYDTASDTDYTNLRSLLGSNKRILFNRFGQKDDCFELSGTFDIPLSISF
jgi:subtilisin family serine protease